VMLNRGDTDFSSGSSCDPRILRREDTEFSDAGTPMHPQPGTKERAADDISPDTMVTKSIEGYEEDSEGGCDVHAMQVHTPSQSPTAGLRKKHLYSTTSLKSVTSEKEELDASWLSADAVVFLTLIKNIIGSGLVTIPLSFKEAGIVPAIFLCALYMVISIYCFLLIISASEQEGEEVEDSQCSGAETLGDIARKAYGEGNEWPVDVFAVTMTYGGTVSYTVLLGEFTRYIFSTVFDVPFLVDNKIVRILCYFVVLQLLILPSDLSALKYASTLGNIVTAYILLLVISLGCILDSKKAQNGKKPEFFKFGFGYFAAIAFFSSSFVCHYNAPKLYEEYKKQKGPSASIHSFQRPVIAAFIASGLLYLGVGLSGYSAFGDNVDGDIFKSLGSKRFSSVATHKALEAGTILYLLMIMTTYPLVFNAMRKSTLRMLETYFCTSYQDSMTTYLVVTEIFLLSQLAVTYLCDDVDVVIEFKGAVIAPVILAVIPVVLYFKLDEDRSTKTSVLGWFCALFAGLAGVLSLLNWIKKIGRFSWW